MGLGSPTSSDTASRAGDSADDGPSLHTGVITARAGMDSPFPPSSSSGHHATEGSGKGKGGNGDSKNSHPQYKRRKKPRLEDCESRVAALRAENETLKRHLDNITNKREKFDKERAAAEKKMKDMVTKGAKDEELNNVLAKFTEMYSDYGKHRHEELTFHLDQLEKLAAPTTFTKMGLWTLGQNDQFYTNPKRNPIAGILMKELGITAAQGRKIIDNREKIRALCANIRQCLTLLGKLKVLCEHKQTVFNTRMRKCQETLTPLQNVKLMLWVDDHSTVLESVCPGWGSERIRGPMGGAVPVAVTAPAADCTDVATTATAVTPAMVASSTSRGDAKADEGNTSAALTDNAANQTPRTATNAPANPPPNKS